MKWSSQQAFHAIHNKEDDDDDNCNCEKSKVNILYFFRVHG